MLTQKKPPKNKAHWNSEHWLLYAMDNELPIAMNEKTDELKIGEYTIKLDLRNELLPIAMSMLGIQVTLYDDKDEIK